MKAIAVRRGAVSVEALRGRVLCHDVRDAGGVIVGHKGERVSEAKAAALLALPWK